MLRPVLAAALLAIGTTAVAQTAGGPPIAYVKRVSNGDEIHLVSPEGTEGRRIYKARSKVQITQLDLRPGGGEVAFLEGFTTLKILAFDDLGRPLAGNPREIRRVSSGLRSGGAVSNPAIRRDRRNVGQRSWARLSSERVSGPP